jgi:hypothetical protein
LTWPATATFVVLGCALQPCWAQAPPAIEGSGSAEYAATVARLGRILSSGDVRPEVIAKEIPGKPERSSSETLKIRARNVTTLIRTSRAEGPSSVRELEMHFDPKLRLLLKQLSDELGPASTVAEGETSSVTWVGKGKSNVQIYATLLSSRVALDAIVISVRIRPAAARR